jgi:acyl-homoserine lactone acylase PvdQ
MVSVSSTPPPPATAVRHLCKKERSRISTLRYRWRKQHGILRTDWFQKTKTKTKTKPNKPNKPNKKEQDPPYYSANAQRVDAKAMRRRLSDLQTKFGSLSQDLETQTNCLAHATSALRLLAKEAVEAVETAAVEAAKEAAKTAAKEATRETFARETFAANVMRC